MTLLEGFGPGFGFRCAGLLALVAFISITLGGTAPINKATLTWEAAAPPEGWRAMINRWERLDTARTSAAVAAFGLFLAAGALRRIRRLIQTETLPKFAGTSVIIGFVPVYARVAMALA